MLKRLILSIHFKGIKEELSVLILIPILGNWCLLAEIKQLKYGTLIELWNANKRNTYKIKKAI